MKYLFENNHLLVIGQFVLAASMVGTWLFMLATGKSIPTEVNTAVFVVIGFFFGAQVNEMVHQNGG